MNVYLINLDKNVERLANCDRQLARLGVSYERFSAIYGKGLPKAEKKRAVNGFLWWCNGGRRIVDGEIGCTLSHYGVYKRMRERQQSVACILEDDVVLDDRFAKQLENVSQWIDVSKPQVVLLSNHTSETAEDWTIKEAPGDCFAESYVITLRAAERIMSINYPLRAAIDSWGRWVRRGGIRCYHAFPSVCTQDWRDGFSTDVYTGEFSPRNYTGIKRMMYKVMRGFGKIIDLIVR